ncbi:5-oxopent-3-ene-1,2,5-tricarboxylate decarboxylase [Pseudonocardia sulfidoxydans NBRC 16205]|uniref:5-oxopent-3-ene-1,2,5-tricarboxylate decarboxylase n=2 Tax=Pseudonocardia sulfidoxydans TaxID=54011 RepID=A0A511DGR7_9PSEU|nr:fumarylacetoacetate hydrolase family protein [Pseudonocardia sulfidoxydans]GEL23717.1 5-oxopent-3-ene-1,2,5-tricarboxylate decarboxylase [Pseudonocardia sulfidoxydans NBRC 16205]
MPYASYLHGGRRRVGRVEHRSDGDHLVPLLGLVEIGRDTPTEVLAGAPELRRESVPVGQVHLLPVVPAPDKIICVGLNYHTHVEESRRDLPAYPVLFTKFASSLVGAHDEIVAPPESAQVDYEGELAVVIGRAGRRIPRERAAEHILGYTVANDVTMRDHQYRSHQWLQGKAWERSTPVGPYLAGPGEVDVAAARIRTEVNGAILQDASLVSLIFDIPTLIATISEFTTVLPGDLILTGTPGGVGFRRDPQVFLEDGTTVTVTIEGVGSLSNRVRREAATAGASTSPAGSGDRGRTA